MPPEGISREMTFDKKSSERPEQKTAREGRAVLSCSSLLPFIDLLQKKLGTSYPVLSIDRAHHAEPEEMKKEVAGLLRKLPASCETVMAAMAFCGGVWDHVSFDRRIVIPKADDCVSILLACDDECIPNRKETGHLYLYEPDPSDFSALTLLRGEGRGRDAGEAYAYPDRETLMHLMFDPYRYMDIIDHGGSDCYTEEYAAAAQKEADRIGAALDYVPGSLRILEKLLLGQWDEQFLVAEPGEIIKHSRFFD